MKEKRFKSGDMVSINCPGVFNGRVGRVIKSEHCKYGDSVYVDLHYDTPEPLSQIFAAEHLELIVGPEEEEKAGEIKDSGERTELSQEFIVEIPYEHIEQLTFENGKLRIVLKTGVES